MGSGIPNKQEKLSFGIEMEFFVAWRAETFTGTVPTPPGFESKTGEPLVVKGNWATEGDRVSALAHMIDEAFPSCAATVAPSEGEIPDYRTESWYHLLPFRHHWDVSVDSSLNRLPVELRDKTGPDFGWVGAEIASPALWATDEGFEEVRRMCEFLQTNLLTFTAPEAGFHVHVGGGNEWLSLSSLRQIAAFLYSADMVLAQSHPEHRYNNAWCPSPRLYSNLSVGIKHLPNQAQPAPPDERLAYADSMGLAKNSSQDPVGPAKPPRENQDPAKHRFSPRPTVSNLKIQTHALERVLSYLGSDLEEIPDPRTYLPTPMMTAVAELLRSPDRRSIARLMNIGQRKGAYSFIQLEREYKRTIEFRQAASMVDPVGVVAYARIAVGLCQFAITASHEDFFKIILDCKISERHPSWYDVYDLLEDVGLYPEAKVVQAVLSDTMTDDMRREYWLSRGHAPRP
ncbi:putative amidoligase enzyme-domain-containing protein [Daldinia vernicosa]|uniref:putative amidoligase enzyme-domain-containing protein n=1 Tax=Daldinia vernicosa TaxID=114800 RepID=UPI002007AC2C|nr:putative amidoligase enzyme-domain-containing protein [Daldinia vernicosa]KAI0849981.1 putative amidoligase enzyme-domain-containing protein [Daldinia vernicosa]